MSSWTSPSFPGSFVHYGHHVTSKNTFVHVCAETDADEETPAAHAPARVRAHSVGAMPQALRAGADVEEWTTVQCWNVPRRCPVERFIDLLDALGFAGRYNYVYMPLQRRQWLNKGFAFVNMKTEQDRVDLLALGKRFAFQLPGQLDREVFTKRSRTQGHLDNLSELWAHVGDFERDSSLFVHMSDETGECRRHSLFQALCMTRGARQAVC